MYTISNPYTKTKQDSNNESKLQVGSGEINSEESSIEEDNKADSNISNLKQLLSESKALTNDDDPLEFNKRKRKLLGSEIQDSFLHPSFVKTSKIVIESKKVQKEKQQNKNDTKKPSLNTGDKLSQNTNNKAQI